MKTILLLILLLLNACVARPIVEIKNDNQHKQQNSQIIQSIREHGITGDWLVTRGYHATDTLVANATSSSISHVGIYNAETREVIEAEGIGVHRSSLNDFVNKSYRLLIIRPRWLTSGNSKKAYSNADKLVGKKYDFLGTLGFNSPEKYYCSELAVSVFKEWHRPVEKFPNVVKPSDLYLYGRVLYDSQPRDEI